MKPWLILCFLLVAALGYSQDFLGRWTVVKVFTTENFQKDEESRMLVLIHQAIAPTSQVAGVLVPSKTEIEFSINPNNQAQHVTLTADGLLLMSLNWEAREAPQPPVDPSDLTLRVWVDDKENHDLYSILFNDSKTLVFSDRSKLGSRFLDIYYLERKE